MNAIRLQLRRLNRKQTGVDTKPPNTVMAQLAGADQVPYCGISILWLSVALCVPFRATVGVSPGKPFGLWMDLTWEKLYGVETRLTRLGRGGHLRAVWLVCKTRPLRERSLSLLDWKTSWNNASFTKQYIKAGNNDILAVTGSDTEEQLRGFFKFAPYRNTTDFRRISIG